MACNCDGCEYLRTCFTIPFCIVYVALPSLTDCVSLDASQTKSACWIRTLPELSTGLQASMNSMLLMQQ